MHNKRLLVMLLLVMLVPSVGIGYPRYYRWWQPPKVHRFPELVVFDNVTTKRAVCQEIHVRHHRVVFKRATKFENNPTLSAAAVKGILFFEPFEIYGETYEGVAKIGFFFDEAKLGKCFYGAHFHTPGIAIINEEFEVPVKMSGSIVKYKGEYRLKARVFGNVCETEVNNVSYEAKWSHKGGASHKALKICKLVKLNLKGFGTEQEPEPEPGPGPGPGPI